MKLSLIGQICTNHNSVKLLSLHGSGLTFKISAMKSQILDISNYDFS